MHRLFVSVVAAAALAASACAVEEDVGGVELTLTGTSPSGHVYRLRNAELTVAGSGATVVLRTEDDPRRERIDFRVRAGRYNLTLATGWYLERVAADGSSGRVPAVLETELPLPFVIQPDRFTPITLRFRVNGDPVDFGDGTGGIDLDIDDSPDAGSFPDAVIAPDAAPPVDAPVRQAIVVAPPVVSVTEGESARFVVTLAAPPFETLAVRVASTSPGVTVSPAVLIFTPVDYQVPHIVVASAVRDPDTNDEAVVVNLVAPGVAEARVLVNVRDVDVAAIVVSPTQVSLTEGQSAAVRVHLSARPAARVAVNAAVLDRQVAVAPATLVFTPENYGVDQVITLTALQDPDTSNGTTLLQLVSPGLETATVPVTIVDDDVQRIIVEPAELVVRERARGAVTVRLAAPPNETLTVAVASQSPLLTVSTAVLLFTASNWSVGQQVAIAAADDADREDNAGTVSFSAPGQTPVRASVVIVDDDR